MEYRLSWSITAAITLLVVIALIIVTRPLADSLVIAGLLAILLNPAVTFMQRRLKLSRTLATGVVFSLLFITVAGLLTAFGAAAWAQLPRWGAELGEIWAATRVWLVVPIRFMGLEFHPELILENLGRAAGNAVAALPVGPMGMLKTVTDNLLWSSVVLVGLFYLLKDGPRLKPWLLSWLPSTAQTDGRRLLNEIDLLWSVFLRMQLLIFLLLGIMFVVSTLLILWLYRSGWLPLSWVGLVVVFILVYAGIQQIDNFWLRPQLLGHSLKLHPGLVFVGLIAALALSGILGAIIIVPVMATIKVLSGYIFARLSGISYWPEDASPGAPDQAG